MQAVGEHDKRINNDQWNNYTVVLHVRCEGKSAEFKKDGWRSPERQAPEILM